MKTRITNPIITKNWEMMTVKWVP